jgi:hypothetical protein
MLRSNLKLKTKLQHNPLIMASKIGLIPPFGPQCPSWPLFRHPPRAGDRFEQFCTILFAFGPLHLSKSGNAPNMNPAPKRRKWIPSRDPIREMTVSIDFWVWTADEHTGEATERLSGSNG